MREFCCCRRLCKSYNGTNGFSNECKLKFVKNKYLDEDTDDVLFHLKLSRKKNDFKAMFGDVKVRKYLHRLLEFFDFTEFK